MITPKPLFRGARVAVISPAGATSPSPKTREEIIAKCEIVLKDLSLEPVFYPSCYTAYGYLAGEDALRAKDVMDAFLDDTIDGIFCIRGGYGVQRLLDLLDFDKIKQHPKWFAGYSDITALHIVLNQRCEMVTYHTPMPSTELIERNGSKGLDEYSMEYLKKAMFGGLQGELPSKTEVISLGKGTCEGILCGGNLSLVSSSLGTPYEIDTKDKILFLEDVNESPYRIDGMLNHMRLAGKLEECKGILLGYFTNCDLPKDHVDPEGEEPAMGLLKIFRDLLPKDKPVLISYSCGHERPTMSLPLGEKAILNGDALTLTIES